MLELSHLALLFIAFAAAKYGIIDRQAELLTLPVSMAFFAAFAYGSYGVEKSFSSGTVDQPALFIVGVGGTLVVLIYLVLEVLGYLPEPTRGDTTGKDITIK